MSRENVAEEERTGIHWAEARWERAGRVAEVEGRGWLLNRALGVELALSAPILRNAEGQGGVLENSARSSRPRTSRSQVLPRSTFELPARRESCGGQRCRRAVFKSPRSQGVVSRPSDQHAFSGSPGPLLFLPHVAAWSTLVGPSSRVSLRLCEYTAHWDGRRLAERPPTSC